MSNAERLTMHPESFKLSGDRAFYSLQGEGTSMGEPSVFLRLHFCNLHCVWCDTPYTWNKEMPEYFSEPEDWTVEQTAERVKELWTCENPDRQKRIVITGGEPLIQQAKIEKLLDLLPDWQVEIETNGTTMPSDKLLARCRFNCSPKLANSENDRKIRINPEVIRAIARVDSIFKFVVTKPEELDEIENDFVKPMGIRVEKVILMPEGTKVEALREHSSAVAEMAKIKGYRVLSRLQVELWGHTRRT